MRLMGAANRDIAYYPFAPSVVPFGSSQFQEWPLFARCCGLCEIDERHIAFLADPVAHDDGHLVLHGLDTDFPQERLRRFGVSVRNRCSPSAR